MKRLKHFLVYAMAVVMALACLVAVTGCGTEKKW